MPRTLLGRPCRNFQFMAVTTLTDPRDGGEKVALGNFVSGGVGAVLLVDPHTGAGEALEIPGDNGPEGLLNLDDQRLLVACSETFGYLHSLDLATRTWAEPLQVESETYLWNLCLASDGLVYGGTYPGGKLVRYDPARHVLDDLGPVSADPDNQYTRNVHGQVPGWVLVDCGMATMEVVAYDLATGERRRVGPPGAWVREATAEFVCLTTPQGPEFYAPDTWERLPDLSDRLSPSLPAPFSLTGLAARLSDGGLVGVRGQDLAHLPPGESAARVVPIDAPRPATRIHTLVQDDRGGLWGASAFGQTIFSYDPATGATWNSPAVTAISGEVYGMVWVGGQLFMSCYCGGDHVVYDPALPWDEATNVNPRTLESVAPALIRPFARSLLGPDGGVWTGWMAAYGTYGGGLSRVDPETLEVTSWYDPVPGQGLDFLTADDRYLYFVTTDYGNGLPFLTDPLHFAVWDPAGEVVDDVTLELGEHGGPLAAVGGRILMVRRDRPEVRVYDPQALRFEDPVPLPEQCGGLLAVDADTALVFSAKRRYRLTLPDRRVEDIGEMPGNATAVALGKRGELYVAVGADLYRVE